MPEGADAKTGIRSLAESQAVKAPQANARLMTARVLFSIAVPALTAIAAYLAIRWVSGILQTL
ncbi:hypothetical protein [Bradyrhizobium sp. dw_78]|uniref:hypothetical protein n=1 Tax=Bradyrhizobium sp. dw_78 TaxID=2719793 RepID=UPI001BD25725|nr:hypothetical protein [Bradyrhizobium sp. dw_78]